MFVILENISVGFVASLHIVFLVLEMFLWNRPIGRKIFGLKREFAEQSVALASNQGLYNGFLAAGLIWSFFIGSLEGEIRIFFLSCIIIAGVFGALTVNRTIFWIQALPAVIALSLVVTN